jgi:hypothetical protein
LIQAACRSTSALEGVNSGFDNVLQHDGIGDQVLVLDAFLLLNRVSRLDGALATEEDPLRKAVASFYFSGRYDTLAASHTGP